MGELPSFSLQGKVIVQFGGSGLLGRALVSAIGSAGATLVITSRASGKLAALVEQERAAGGAVSAEEVDLRSEASLQVLRDRVTATHGGVDGVVFNAVARPMRAWSDPIEHWKESMETNATGYFAAVRIFGDAMATRRGGSIVAISSTQGLIGINPWLYEGTDLGAPPDYFFHKAGMINLTRYMATHYGPKGVRVNVVAPGGILNPERPPPASVLERYG